jgi:hypothetical protein
VLRNSLIPRPDVAPDMSDASNPFVERKTVAAAVAAIALLVVLLILAGRPVWCKHGFGVWAPALTHCTSQHLLDAYTLSHVLHGVIFYWLLVPLAGRVSLPWRLIAALSLEIGWELIENSPWVIAYYRDNTASLDYAGDSIVNSLCDALASIAGFVFASRVSWKWAVALFIALELWALYLARDNLTLNIIMFLFPLEGLKEWQWAGMR